MQKRAWRCIETRIGVDLNQVHLAILVYHKIVPEHLELIQYFILVGLFSLQPHPKRFESSSYGISDFGQNNGIKVDIFTILQEGSEILEGYFVARFIFGILLAIDLNCIVGQMDISIS